MFKFTQFLTILTIIVLFIYIILTYKAYKECDGILIRGAVWYECIDIERKNSKLDDK